MATARFDAAGLCDTLDIIIDYTEELVKLYERDLWNIKELRIQTVIDYYSNRRFFKKTITRDKARALLEDYSFYRIKYSEMLDAQDKLRSINTKHSEFLRLRLFSKEAITKTVDKVVTLDDDEFKWINDFYHKAKNKMKDEIYEDAGD